MKYLGCSYYPEYWGSQRYEIDAKLMKEAGINIVRIGEFAWTRMEPEEGIYNFDWLHECIEVMGGYSIDVIMCTPTATPPSWLTNTYQDTLLMKSNKIKMEHGERRHYCYSSDTYRRHTKRIVEKLSKDLSKHKNIVAWQIDNEPDFCETGICHCESCQGKFQAWLKERYTTINELNKKWATGFWSMDYSDWSQVKLGEQQGKFYSSRKLDTFRFTSYMLSDFLFMQAEIIRNYHPEALISTNIHGGIFTDIDYNNIFSKMDVVFKDLYYDIGTMEVSSLLMEQCRSFKPGKKYWITETGSGALDFGKPPHKDQFKAWLWSSYAHGGDAHIVFRWRTCLSGHEQELQGLLEHSGHPGHRYKNVKQAFLEMRKLSKEIGDLPLPEAEVAIIHQYDVLWGYKSSVVGSELDYEKNFCMIYNELYKKNVRADIITTDREFRKYKLIILPSLMMIDEAFAIKLKEYVNNGGVLFAQGQIGIRDFNDNYLLEKGPKHLKDLLGVEINGGMYLFSHMAVDEAMFVPERKKSDIDIKVEGKLGEEIVRGTASTWIGDIVEKGGTPLLKFAEDTYEGQLAVVKKITGKGSSLYMAAIEFDEELMENLTEYVLLNAGVEFNKNIPKHVEIIKRGNVLFIINHRMEEVKVDLGISGKVLKGIESNGVIELSAYGLCIMKI